MNTISSRPQPPVQGKFGKVTVLAEGYLGAPKISGDGKTVTWDEVVDDNTELMQFSNGNVFQLTHDGHASMLPAVSADGRVISYTRWSSTDPQDPNGNWDVYALRDGQPSAVASSAANEFFSDVSRDGKTIVFDCDGDGKGLNWNIGKWRDGQLEDVTQGKGLREGPVVDGDGNRIVWRDSTTGQSRLVMRDENGQTKLLLHERVDQLKPYITPDGTRVVYTANTGRDDDLRMWNEGQVTAISADGKADETFGTASADGQQVAWTRFDFSHGTPADTEIFLRDGDQDAVQISTQDGGIQAYPSISDDGKTIAWLWVHPTDLNRCKILMLERDAPPTP